MELVEGNMIVLQYKAKFTKLASFGPHITVDYSRKAKKFQQ